MNSNARILQLDFSVSIVPESSCVFYKCIAWRSGYAYLLCCLRSRWTHELITNASTRQDTCLIGYDCSRIIEPWSERRSKLDESNIVVVSARKYSRRATTCEWTYAKDSWSRGSRDPLLAINISPGRCLLSALKMTSSNVSGRCSQFIVITFILRIGVYRALGFWFRRRLLPLQNYVAREVHKSWKRARVLQFKTHTNRE